MGEDTHAVIYFMHLILPRPAVQNLFGAPELVSEARVCSSRAKIHVRLDRVHSVSANMLKSLSQKSILQMCLLSWQPFCVFQPDSCVNLVRVRGCHCASLPPSLLFTAALSVDCCAETDGIRACAEVRWVRENLELV